MFRIERLLERFTDHILFVSEHERRSYLSKVGVPHCPSSLVYNGLRDDEFEPVTAAPDAADLLYIGMMRDLKGPDILIEAIARTQAMTGRRLSAVMVGDGADLPRYRQQVGELGLAGQVTFRAAMPAREAFGLGRLMVVPSRAEAMPYIVLEALAARRPMIATAVGGIPEILGANSPALTEPDSELLAGKIAYALEDEAGFAAAMPDEAQLRGRFGADVMARAVEAAYRESLGLPAQTGAT